MMVMCYGRSNETVRIKNKPIGSGFKLWALCDSGYMFHAFPHSNRDRWRECKDYKNVLTHSSAVIARLTEFLPRRPYSPTVSGRQMYVVFMDNLFATPKLFALLRLQDIGAVGTVRSTAKGFPKELALRNKKKVNLDWNTLGAKLCEGGKVLGLTWIDNGPVQMLTTMHQVGPEHTEERERKRKRPRITSTNGRKIRAVFGNAPVKTLPIPKVFDDYNYHMGGVDIADQLRAVYTSHLPSRRTWMPLFFWMLDSCATNSYLILSKLDNSWKNNHRRFVTDLAWNLVDGYARTKTDWVGGSVVSTRNSGTNKRVSINMGGSKQASAGGYVTSKTFLPGL